MGMLHAPFHPETKSTAGYFNLVSGQFITVVTRIRQADKSRININLVLCTELKLYFVAKNSLAKLNHF